MYNNKELQRFSMGKPLVLLISLLVILQANSVLALEENDCFEHYEFSVGIKWVDFLPGKVLYAPAEDIFVSYKTTSIMAAPVVEGQERVQVFFNHPERGEEMVDEFFVQGDLNLMKGDSIERDFTWTIPPGSPSGEYSMKIYFVVGNTYNLAGLSMVPYGPPGVPGDMFTFKVQNTKESYLYFDKKRTTLDGEQYEFSTFAPVVTGDAKIITTSLASVGNAKSAEIMAELYEWDDLSGQPLKTERTIVQLSVNEPASYSFTTPLLDPNAYELRLTATSGAEKALLKMRFGVEGSRARLIYSGLTQFPLSSEEPVKAFICMSNAADHSNWFAGTGTLSVMDQNGEIIYTEELGSLDIPPTPYGLVTSFTPDVDLTKATLEVELRDQTGEVVDMQRLEYDYSKFINIGAQLDVGVKKTKIEKNTAIDYTVSLEAKGIPLQGNLVIYLLDPNGVVFHAEEAEIDGVLSGSFKAAAGDGTYTLKVKEPLRDLEDQAIITVGSATTTTEFPWYVWLLPLAAVVLIIVFLLKKKTSLLPVLILIVMLSGYAIPTAIASSTHFQPQPEPDQDLNSLGVGSGLKAGNANGVVGVNFYMNGQLDVGNNVLKSSDSCCTNDILTLSSPEMTGEFFAKGGPSDSPPVQFTDEMEALKAEINEGTYTTKIYNFTICSWRRAIENTTGPNRCVIDGAIICEKNCDVKTGGLLDLGNNQYRVVGDRVNVKLDCTPKCIIFVDRKEQEYIGHNPKDPVTLERAYGYMDISSANGVFSPITNAFDIGVKQVPVRPEIETTFYKPKQVALGDEFNLRVEVTNTGGQKAYIRGIDLGGAQSKVLYKPKTLAPGETEDIIVRASPTTAQGMTLNIQYDAEDLGCLNSRGNQQSFSVGSVVARGEACSFDSDCPGSSCCGGICRPGKGVCDDIDGDGVLDFWISE